MADMLKIGELARRAGVTAKAIRFYETRGVLSLPRRGPNGYRLYSEDTVDVLAFVKQAIGLGLTLAEIGEIITIRQGGRPPCDHAHRLLKEKAAELDRKLADLLVVRTRIRRSLAAWNRAPVRPAAVCPHVEEGRAGTSPLCQRRSPGAGNPGIPVRWVGRRN